MTRPRDDTPHLAPGQAEKIARLARLALSEQEAAGLQADLERILAHVAQLDEVDVAGVEPLAQPVPLDLPLRGDEPRPAGVRDELLEAAPDRERGHFRVPRVVDA
ncbi:MAG: Asp-tRNA(Asn)/Glu-tRNA(Gln) amidotransferase subunit GatC [Thermoanaerobaculia bacterium]|nr:Asp-tRNA(Asn)/Glu-tRNA(Gln) amidotransferase subunit GatC [Thermoanaerobaculia bacterium]